MSIIIVDPYYKTLFIFVQVGYNSKPRNPSGSLQKIKPSLISVPKSPRSSKYTSVSVDDAFRFGGPAGKFSLTRLTTLTPTYGNV